ncbi:hypothetical protein [Paenarthrobacter sp. NPDC090522]|uniref:hypothetical protein n=1 Tax=Paenarthrobacter sp. NPDC090522 TaxID=3364383 RepID=UPI003805EFA5
MLQPVQKSVGDKALPYLRAAHIQPNGRLDLAVEGNEMWFTEREQSLLDLCAGDVVVVEGGAVGRSAFLREDIPGWGFQNAVLRLRPRAGVDGRYIDYCLQSAVNSGAVEAVCTPVSIAHFTAEKVARFRIPFHGEVAQRTIADYLDRETVVIDVMIAKLEELSEKLKIRRSTTASSLHTMGFGPVRLQWLMSEVDERAGDSLRDLPLLSVSIHHGVQLREESTSRQQASVDLSRYKVVRAGEIVLNRMRAFQGGLGKASVDGLVSPDYAVLRPHSQLVPDWAEHVMRSSEFVRSMSQWLRGIGAADQSKVRTPRINVRDLLGLSIPLPSTEEQRNIVGSLDEMTAKLDAMLGKVADLKSLLFERRAALITDVVTGKKEVA